MSIPVQCPACGTSYQVKEALAGKTAKCKKCGGPILIPAAPDGPATDPLGSPALPPADEDPWDVPAVGRTLSGLTSYTPAASAPRKDAHDHSASQGGRTVPFNPRRLLVVTGVVLCVLMIGVAVWSVVSRVRAFVAVNQSRQRIAALFDEASPPPGSPERFESPNQRYNRVAKDLAPEIANVPAVIEKLAKATGDRAKREQKILSELISRLPPEADVLPLVETPQDCFAYQAVRTACLRGTDREWRLKTSCQAGAHGRLLAADLLRETFPFGQFDDGQLPVLAEATSLDEKRKRYAALYDAVHRTFEEQLCGDYILTVDARYRPAQSAPQEGRWVSPSPVLRVTCADKKWRAQSFTSVWEGTIDGLPSLALQVPDSEAIPAAEAFPFRSEVKHALVTVRFVGRKFVAGLGPFPPYLPGSSGTVREGQSAPPGATVQVFYRGGVRQMAHWSTPDIPGFDRIDCSLARVDSK